MDAQATKFPAEIVMLAFCWGTVLSTNIRLLSANGSQLTTVSVKMNWYFFSTEIVICSIDDLMPDLFFFESAPTHFSRSSQPSAH